jgi:hypothetical protein
MTDEMVLSLSGFAGLFALVLLVAVLLRAVGLGSGSTLFLLGLLARVLNSNLAIGLLYFDLDLNALLHRRRHRFELNHRFDFKHRFGLRHPALLRLFRFLTERLGDRARVVRDRGRGRGGARLRLGFSDGGGGFFALTVCLAFLNGLLGLDFVLLQFLSERRFRRSRDSTSRGARGRGGDGGECDHANGGREHRANLGEEMLGLFVSLSETHKLSREHSRGVRKTQNALRLHLPDTKRSQIQCLSTKTVNIVAESFEKRLRSLLHSLAKVLKRRLSALLSVFNGGVDTREKVRGVRGSSGANASDLFFGGGVETSKLVMRGGGDMIEGVVKSVEGGANQFLLGFVDLLLGKTNRIDMNESLHTSGR